MLTRLKVSQLNQQIDVDLTFHNDINVLTGKNGSGKTTLLKLIWYLMSANIERVIPEINFRAVEIQTSKFTIYIETTKKMDSQTQLELDMGLTDRPSTRISSKEDDAQFYFKWDFGDGTDSKVISRTDYLRSDLADILNQRILLVSQPTIFFPTFRRVEGGFAPDRYVRSVKGLPRYAPPRNPLQLAMNEFSSNLSTPHHRFVSSISTDDIVDLLTKEYADVSEQTNRLNGELSEFITKRISEYSDSRYVTEGERLGRAGNVLNEVQSRVNRNREKTDSLLRPFSVLSQLVSEIFHYKGIRITEGVTLGEAREAISSDKLSSGEKQMLSFLCYNAFAQDSVIFIDEPELSLHVDWQRLLFPTLLTQQTTNQFVVATHSPFIYSKFPDKELMLEVNPPCANMG